LYRDFIAPVQENQQHIAQIEDDIASAGEMVDTKMAQIGDRLVELEGRLAVQAEDLAALEALVESLRDDQSKQEDEVARLEVLPEGLSDLEVTVLEMAAKLEAIEADLAEIGIPANRLQYQLHLVRVMTLLTRARVSLVQDNLGLASEDIQAASEMISAMVERGTETEIEILTPILNRLEMAYNDIRISPVIAADELEIAWKLLVEATEFSETPVAPEVQPTENAQEESNGTE